MNMNTADDVIRELAAGLRDLIREAPMAYLESDPENAFVDLASRFVFRLREKLTFVPASQSVRNEEAEAALRILNIFTQWMIEHPDHGFSTVRESSGKFSVSVMATPKLKAYFQGGSVQDAYAQMAQTIVFNEGSL